jgi:hypothetical protein
MLKAKRVSDNADVVATEVARGPEYRCPECNQLVIIRKGPKIIHHFAHRADASCAYGRGETQAHLRAKLMLRDAFRSRGFQADVEQVVLSSESDRRADVLIWKPNTDRRVAIEVQHSYLSPPDIERRTKAYMAAGVPVIWIGLLKWTKSLNGDCEPAYSSRGWQDWAHEYNGGHLWLLDLDIAVGKMWRVWFRGPYSSTLREGPFDIQSLRIKLVKRRETPHGHLGPMPSGLLAWLLTPKDDKRPSNPELKLSLPQSQPQLKLLLPQSQPAFLKAAWRRRVRSRGGPRL